MDTAASNVVHPIRDSPLPPAPLPDDIFTPAQWDTLLAIADTVIPGIRLLSGPSNDHLASSTGHGLADAEFDKAKTTLQFGSRTTESSDHAVRYLAENASAVAEFKESISRTMGLYVPTENRRGLSLVLYGLNNPAISLILTGSSTPFQGHPFRVREAIFRGWEKSYLGSMRAIYRSMIALCSKTWITLSPTLPKVLGFPRVPVHGKRAEGYPHQFLQFPPGDNPEVVETDVVVVGSGIGAGVTAKNLSEAGHRVMVVERSHFFPENHFPMEGKQASAHLFQNGGALLSDDQSIGVLSGSTWGGGGTVNWSASLQTQSMVRQEWDRAGLPFFTSKAFQSSLDRVCDRMGVSTDHIEHNHSNQTIMEGARKLGYTVKPVPQNTGYQKHQCGYCSYGCQGAVKQGPAVSTLADAARAGATFVEGFNVEKVLFDETTNSDGQKVPTGVQGTWASRDANQWISGEPVVKRKVIIKAKKVVVSCGSLESPLLLRRSGLKNPNIGRNLYLHPVIILSARFDYDVNPWEGSILTSAVNEFENLDGHGHGTKIEAVSMLPALALPLFPWKSGLDFKLFAANLRRTSGFISLTRDRDPGRVYPDPVDGRCRVQYTPSEFDRQHVLEGLIGAAKIAYISGAREIRTTCSTIPPFVRSDSSNDEDGINDPSFQAWIKKLRQGVPLDPASSSFASAHQMGTCRMGTSPRRSVVGPTGQVWGTDGLYVADASVFPSASGVNPMVTNMAISDWTSRTLAGRMSGEKRATGAARL